MPDIMIDIETLDTRPTAMVVAIGAVEFDLHCGELRDRFSCLVRLDSGDAYGRTVSTDTIRWWMRRTKDVQAQLDGETPLVGALHSLAAWFFKVARESPEETRVWANGANFDTVILEDAMRACGVAVPWVYGNVRCYRTAMALRPEHHPYGPAPHTALGDATRQALALLAAYGHNPTR